MNEEPLKIGDRVLARWPSGWPNGGTVLMVIQEREKPPQYDVLLLGNTHHLFPEASVTRVSP